MPLVRSRLWWVLLLMVIASGGLVWAVTNRSPDSATPAPGAKPGGGPPALPVEAAKIRVGAVSDEVGAVGTLDANESVMIHSEIDGRIQQIHFAEGQTVEQGLILVTLDPTELQAQYEQATATMELNQLNYERAKPLHEEQLLSQQAYDELAARLKESQANLALAKARLDKTTIRAPFAGRLGLRQVSPGHYVQAGQTIINLEDLDPLKVDIRVPEMYLQHIHVGGAVQVSVDAFPDEPFAGSVYAIDPRIDQATRALVVRARISNAGNRLRPGMFARVNAVLAQRPNALLIPEQAIVPKGADKFVFRVVDGKAVLTKVTLGQRRPGEVEILTGLDPQSVVITGGQAKPMIFDGAPVMVIGPGGPTDAPKPG